MYQWTITKDFMPDESAKPASNANAAGLVGPSDATMTHDEIVNHPEGKKFRMLDDDNEVYYEGIIVGGDGFEPLDDFGTPNAGCTIIQYREKQHWKSL